MGPTTTESAVQPRCILETRWAIASLNSWKGMTARSILSLMANLAYYTSERFIWDSLIHTVEKVGISTLYDSWRRRKKIEPFIITWPASIISVEKRDNTIKIAGPCIRDLTGEKSEWRRQMVEAIKLTNAYAIVLVQQRADAVFLILESHHGVKNWLLPIVRSGDTNALGPVRSPDGDQEPIGLLWSSAKQAS